MELWSVHPSLTQTLVNGHAVGTGDWFVLSQVQTVGRSVSYSLLPSEIVSQVVVHKTSEAKLVEGGAAGSVDIITRKPLDFDKPFTAELSVGTVYSDLPDNKKPQLDALLNWKNDSGNFGILFQPFYEKRSLRRDGQEVVGGYAAVPGTTSVDVNGDGTPETIPSAVSQANPGLVGLLYPNEIGSVLFEQQRERKGATVDIQWKASDTLSFNLNGFYSKLKADNYNRNYMMWASHALANGATFSDATVKNGVITSGKLNGDGVANIYNGAAFANDGAYGIYDMISRPGASSQTNYITLDADWQATEALGFKFQAGTSEGIGKSPTQDVIETGTQYGSGASWAMNGIGKPIDWSMGNDYGNPASSIPAAGWIFGGQDIEVKDKEDWFSADGTFTFTDGALASLDFGVRYTDHNRHNDYEIAQGPNWATPWNDPSSYPTSASQYPGNFGNALGGNTPSGIWYYTPEQLAAFNAQYANRNYPERFYFSDVYGVKEKNAAAYIQANFQGDSWSGNVGVRYVHTDGDIRYNQALAVNSGLPGAVTGSAFGDYLPVKVENNYGKFLPSANIKFDLADDLVLRFAGSQTLTRPDYSALAGSLSLDDLTHTGSGGNPELKPLVSSNFDTSIEWYFMPRGLLAASAFYMKMKDYVDVGGSTVIQYKDQQASHAAGTDVYSNYTVTVPVNTDAKVKGIELTYQQPIGEHFGVNANYTYTDGDTDTDTPMFGTSKNTYNVAGYFENDTFSARVSYSYRDKFYAGASRATPFYQDDFGALSASLGWKVTDHLSVSLDGLNLNNPKYKYYTDTTAGFLPYAVYSNGRQYYLNLRAKF
ncbi:TonB-dependent receptor [Pseudoxanthomonas winnipegensis]|uniref:TonB-dependent receptor n=1 Tax=Pseudoxanthomonas winnipegensis TaxID=2480810 RepID=UPI00102DDD51|nr:TonB-dependent receptor [Pseudoxanthomonas winnipegensis]TAA40065.1 TonB-dependent receptor [Pseudoxanthomonas winnipegensis]